MKTTKQINKEISYFKTKLDYFDKELRKSLRKILNPYEGKDIKLMTPVFCFDAKRKSGRDTVETLVIDSFQYFVDDIENDVLYLTNNYGGINLFSSLTHADKWKVYLSICETVKKLERAYLCMQDSEEA